MGQGTGVELICGGGVDEEDRAGGREEGLLCWMTGIGESRRV